VLRAYVTHMMLPALAKRILALLALLLSLFFRLSVAFAKMAAGCRDDVIDLTNDEDDEPVAVQERPKRLRGNVPRGNVARSNVPQRVSDGDVVIIDDDAPSPPPKDVLAPWTGFHGTKRVLSEYKHLDQTVQTRTAPCYALEMPDQSDAHVWQFKLKDFDSDHPGGRALNADLARLQQEHGVDHLLCEVSFPRDYPHKPFFLRLVRPRCCWYTGHVTAGGSICIEALTQTGTVNSWRPDYCVSGLLPLVKHNLIDVETVQVRTATGPGGIACPLRIDFDRRWHRCAPVEPYSKHEAEAAFARTEAHHRQNGW